MVGGEVEEVQGQIVCSGPQYGLWLFKQSEAESHDLTGVFTGSPVPPLLPSETPEFRTAPALFPLRPGPC